ncbi:DTW domain-containing protein 2-like [Selaginella moellendorffii]|uniref:DTW domain-containing protein 2-like n=1 Tax=Selaginella moellendorffii TaxID=88036 RepID=UPI000D1C98F7|nr:DTW domain-containing protein 2-like [Selaginella moellendorffii]|eukprot:XP_024528619.1 DTW domain-containing protein 2-like [Selaginella moellendorffii]
MRPRCDGCDRPCAACLCPAMPKERIQTRRTSVIVLQHPLETRQKLATVPILAKCLHPDSCEVIVGRRLRKGCSAHLDRLLGSPGSPALQPVLLLFPTPDATEISSWARIGDGAASAERIVLLIVDATWQHAKEMVSASMEFLRGFAIPVCLPFDKRREGLGMGGNSDLILKKEPYHGCMSSMEAVARALGVLEGENGGEIERALLSVLHRMVSLQISHLPQCKN